MREKTKLNQDYHFLSNIIGGSLIGVVFMYQQLVHQREIFGVTTRKQCLDSWPEKQNRKFHNEKIQALTTETDRFSKSQASRVVITLDKPI